MVQIVSKNRPIKRLKNDKGVTLVEVMVALVIFLIVFMGLMQTALLSIDSNVKNVIRDEAITIANGEMDRLKTLPFSLSYTDPDLAAGTTCPSTPISRDFRNMSKDYYICRIITDLPDAGGTVSTKNIEVIVGWDHKRETAAQAPTNREFQHSITTIRRRS